MINICPYFLLFSKRKEKSELIFPFLRKEKKKKKRKKKKEKKTKEKGFCSFYTLKKRNGP